MCCTRLAEIQDAKIRQLRSIAQLCRTISSQLRRASTIGKKLFNGNMSSTRSHNMVNFGPLMAEIGWRVWDTPANFNGFSRLGFVNAPTLLNGGHPNFEQCLAVSWPGTLHVHY